MKSYTVHVEAEDFIEVEAETDEEAIEKAIAEAEENALSADWKAMVMHSRPIDDDEND